MTAHDPTETPPPAGVPVLVLAPGARTYREARVVKSAPGQWLWSDRSRGATKFKGSRWMPLPARES